MSLRATHVDRDDTDSAVGATWLLSVNPDVQNRLRAEVLKHIPTSDSSVAVDAGLLDSMEYLTAVCNEVLRLYPTVPNTARTVVRDTTIGGHKVPKGVMIVMAPWAINRYPGIWGKDADRFEPDRWLGEGKPAQGNPYNFATFLHGPRSCIGMPS